MESNQKLRGKYKIRQDLSESFGLQLSNKQDNAQPSWLYSLSAVLSVAAVSGWETLWTNDHLNSFC